MDNTIHEMYTFKGFKVVPIKLRTLGFVTSQGKFYHGLDDGFVYEVGKDVFYTEKEAYDYKLEKMESNVSYFKEKLTEARENLKVFKEKNKGLL